MPDDICPKNSVNGRVKVWYIDEQSPAIIPLFEQHNQIQYTWGPIAARALGLRPQPDRPSYHISAVYFEFENVTTPETTITEALTFPKEQSISYYNSFGNSRDFLRVPLIIQPTLSTSIGYENKLPIDHQANQLTFFAQTAGNVGVRGLNFSSVVNSKIFAAALVAAPDFNDPTKDIIFARTVFSAAHQVPKESSSQIGITWNIAFT